MKRREKRYLDPFDPRYPDAAERKASLRQTYKLTVQSRGMIVDALRCAAIAMDALAHGDKLAEDKATQLAELTVVMCTAREIIQGPINDD